MADSNSDPNSTAPRSTIDSLSPSSRPLPLATTSSTQSHRQTLGDALRGHPPSPRARRQPSLTQAAIQSLIDNPPSRTAADPAFSGRNWTQISIEELLDPEDFKFVEADTNIEDATNLLINSNAPVLLIRESQDASAAIGTFDYADLNAYLLLVVGLVQLGEDEHATSLREIAARASVGQKIPLEDLKGLGLREQPLTTLPPSATLVTAVETFGGGVHHIIVAREKGSEVVGVLTQWKLVKFLWENARSFPVIEQLFPQYLRELAIGSHEVISINGDRPLSHALELMNNEGISSVAVVDNQWNVVGNISVIDVKLLTKSTSLPLLHNTCIHFISVILSTRGITEGQDSFPVFYINPQSTLAHTVAKLVATKSHRLWVTDPQSPASSAPPTPSLSSVHLPSSLSQVNITSPSTGSNSGAILSSSPGSTSSANPIHTTGSGRPSPAQLHPTFSPPSHAQPHHPTPPASSSTPLSTIGNPPPVFPMTLSSSIPSSSLPGARLSGRLVGVISLTDILNLYARSSGLKPADPNISRSQRRQSSSSGVSLRKSGDFARELLSGSESTSIS